jgi:hydroxyethylthiazole kinase
MSIDYDHFGDVAGELLARLRSQRPLIHHITNFVVMNDTANATLALGALPVMAHAKEEVAEMVQAAGALVLNPGTLEPDWVEAMLIAGRRAGELGIPVIYDPVGVGATKYRSATGELFLRELRLAAVRGNSGEIGSLSGAGGLVKGVDSAEGVADPAAVTRTFAKRIGAAVAITGKRDVVSDGSAVAGVDNGHEMMTLVTGTGCMATTAVAAFCAVESDRLAAATAALVCYGIAGQEAARVARSPGSFRTALIDAIYELTPAKVAAEARSLRLQG